MMLLVGVDGGGTHTRALAVLADGTLVGRGRSGPSNQQVVGVEGAAAAVREAVLEALAGRRPDAVGACLAGVDLPEHGDLLQATLSDVLATRVHVDNDIAAALWAVPGDAVGVVASGTGAAVALRQDGVARRLLALNEYTGPQGGAGDIATLALREAILAAQGAAPPTRLTERILGLFGLPDHVALARATETGTIPHWQVALLVAPLCAELAAEGDAGARQVLRTAGRELGRVAGRYFRAQGLARNAPVACYGSLLRGGPPAYRDAFHRTLRSEFQAGREPRGTLDADAGAVLFAAAREGVHLPRLAAALARRPTEPGRIATVSPTGHTCRTLVRAPPPRPSRPRGPRTGPPWPRQVTLAPLPEFES